MQFCFSELQLLLGYMANSTLLHRQFYFSSPQLLIFCVANVTFLLYQFYFHFKAKFTSTFSHVFALPILLSNIANFTVLDCLFHGSLVPNVIFLHCRFHFFALLIPLLCTANLTFLHWLFHFYALPISIFLHCLFHSYALPISIFLHCLFHFCTLPISLFCAAYSTFMHC